MADAKTIHKNSLKVRFTHWLSVRTKKQRGFLWTVFGWFGFIFVGWIARDLLDSIFAGTKGEIVDVITSPPLLLTLGGISLFLIGALFATFLEEIWTFIKRLFGKGGQSESEEFSQKRLEELENVYHEGAELLSMDQSYSQNLVWENEVHQWNIQAEKFLNKFCPPKEARKYRMSPKIPFETNILSISQFPNQVRIALEKRLEVLKEIVNELS